LERRLFFAFAIVRLAPAAFSTCYTDGLGEPSPAASVQTFVPIRSPDRSNSSSVQR
jgi:hypothetical protein